MPPNTAEGVRTIQKEGETPNLHNRLSSTAPGYKIILTAEWLHQHRRFEYFALSGKEIILIMFLIMMHFLCFDWFVQRFIDEYASQIHISAYHPPREMIFSPQIKKAFISQACFWVKKLNNIKVFYSYLYVFIFLSYAHEFVGTSSSYPWGEGVKVFGDIPCCVACLGMHPMSSNESQKHITFAMKIFKDAG